MKFGEKLYDLRKKNGYTKVELAKMLGVTTRTIAGYEKEERYPKKREIYQKLSDIFHDTIFFSMLVLLYAEPLISL